MTSVAFFVPIEPRGKPRPKFNRSGGAFNHPLVGFVEGVIAEHAVKAMAGRPLLSGPLAMSLSVQFKPLARQSGIAWHIARPDLDNLMKMACDACNGVVYADDAAVCRAVLEKVRTTSDPEGFSICVAEIGDAPPNPQDTP